MTDAADNPAGMQPPTNRMKTQSINDQQEKHKSHKKCFVEVLLHNGQKRLRKRPLKIGD